LIERQCFNAVKRQLKSHGPLNNPVNIENEALELSNQVLDILQHDDYRVLRQFKGDAKLSTYITTIIARQSVDMIRKKLGRSREKERAQQFGKTGMLIYEKVILQGWSIPEIYPELKSTEGISESPEELETLAEKIRGKKGSLSPLLENNPVVKNGAAVDEEGDYIIPDTKNDPQELLIEQQRKQKLDELIKDIIAQLNGEERIILRMRFPANEEKKPEKVERISKVLGISEKAVYKRITRLLKKCRTRLEQQGVTINDLL
ncbi:MAG: sigma-70 family RNA polymerase sigma factor, partial [Candidatus Aminicenantes bacterium]